MSIHDIGEWRAPNPPASVLIETIRADNPRHHFAINSKGTGIGVWSDKLGRYQTIAGWGIHGKWVELRTEVWIDGKPIDTYPAE